MQIAPPTTPSIGNTMEFSPVCPSFRSSSGGSSSTLVVGREDRMTTGDEIAGIMVEVWGGIRVSIGNFRFA